MKKTLIITLEFPPTIGGIATYIHDLATALNPEQTVVLAPEHTGAETWDKEQPYTIIRKRLLYPPFLWPRWIKLFFLVRKIVRKERIELLMIHHVLPVGYIGVLIKKFFKIPFLLFSHGTDLVAGTATPWKKRMVTKVSMQAEHILFNSESLKTRFLRILPSFESKTTVVYPCPETTFSVPPSPEEIDILRKKYALQGKQVLLTVSRITDGKGFPHLIRMMPQILEKNPNLVWLIVGDGDKRKEIISLIQKAYLQNIVRYVGEVPHAELRAFYHLADLFVLLTHPDEGREEGLGLVFLEAAAAGLPVVAGKSGGVEEAVIHGDTGMVVDIYQGDQKVVDTILALLVDTEKRKVLGRNAQGRIATVFNWEEQMRKLAPWIS
ncbi:MAG TPA: glycosyltransferase family 4 protein [Candidatus Kapabacteria bacterium]|nr:glycosyltransferase family 4 protein [Candidatus Kapabacteria bacterium]